MKLRYFCGLRNLPVFLMVFICFESFSVLKAEPSMQSKLHKQWFQDRQSMFHAGNLTVKGNIMIPGYQDKMPEFRIYFDGKETFSNQEGFYSLPVEEGNLNQYSLLICKGLKQNFEKNNTIKNLVMFTHKGYKYFSVKRSAGADSWEWKEQKLKSGDFVVPLKTIVVVMDPTGVDHIENWNISLPSNFVALPRIVLKKRTQEKLKQVSTKSLLYSLDLKPFHETIREERKTFASGKGHCSLMR